jgi:hypothetical protein
MPFTPYHMGPGFAVKLVARHRFSLTVFGLAQIAMDLEPLYRILHRDRVVHGLSHTYLGALVIGLIIFVPAQRICSALLKLGNALLSCMRLEKFEEDHRISWRVALVSALIGTLSHVLIDSPYHHDMMPMVPFATTNALLHAVSELAVYLFCVLSGSVGFIGWLVIKAVRHRPER